MPRCGTMMDVVQATTSNYADWDAVEQSTDVRIVVERH